MQENVCGKTDFPTLKEKVACWEVYAEKQAQYFLCSSQERIDFP